MISSPAVMGCASQRYTAVTTWQTAQMDLMKDIAVSPLQGGVPFLIFSGFPGILINLLELRG